MKQKENWTNNKDIYRPYNDFEESILKQVWSVKA